MNLILDAGVLVAYLDDEPGADVVEQMLFDDSNTCFAHSVNLCEVYYHFARLNDAPTARGLIDGLLASGVVERSDMDQVFWQRVGDHKARGKISLADCFCIALSERLQGEVLTTDHAEFEPLVPLNICKIRFIR